MMPLACRGKKSLRKRMMYVCFKIRLICLAMKAVRGNLICRCQMMPLSCGGEENHLLSN